MDVTLKLPVLLCVVLSCNGAGMRKQLAEIAQTLRENRVNERRFNMHEGSAILGAPLYPSHLPEAESILPGHTLLRPTLGMLKSAVKFPHKELENGAGVYGNINNLGLKYDSRNERLMYSGFRRTPTDLFVVMPKQDTSSEELSELRQSKNRYQPKNTVKRILKIFPIQFNKRPPAINNMHDKRQHLILLKPPTMTKTSDTRNKKSIFEADLTLDDEPSLKGQSYDIQHGQSSKALRLLDNKLYSSSKTRLFAKQLLEKMRSAQKRRQQGIVVLNPEDDGGLDQRFEGREPQRDETTLMHGKDAFNHIKINPDAPDHEDYLPADFIEGNTYDSKKWWYYHEYDFIPFDEHHE